MRRKFMRRRQSWPLVAAVALTLAISVTAARAQTVLNSAEAARTVTIESLHTSASAVSGVVANRSPHIVRDVEILVQYHWLWENEFKPGQDSPGLTALVRIQDELKPGQSARFHHTLTPATGREDGRFAPEVTVAAFTVVVPAR
jgi:hypothetical protein